MEPFGLLNPGIGSLFFVPSRIYLNRTFGFLIALEMSYDPYVITNEARDGGVNGAAHTLNVLGAMKIMFSIYYVGLKITRSNPGIIILP